MAGTPSIIASNRAGLQLLAWALYAANGTIIRQAGGFTTATVAGAGQYWCFISPALPAYALAEGIYASGVATVTIASNTQINVTTGGANAPFYVAVWG